MKKNSFLCLIIMLLLFTTVTLCQSVDTDEDGLSDFQEIHKYLTNPTEPDTDNDGINDGDWNERREYAYTVRSIMRFMHPFDDDVLNDNFQDARVLKEEDYYTELEVIHYPFGTAENSISANPDWQQDYAGMTEYLQPGITSNWNNQMKQDLLSELQADGIIVGNLTDKQAIGQVSYWMYHKYNSLSSFTTFYIHYPNSQPEIYPGLEWAFERDKGTYGWTVQEQFEHELLGKGMYYNKTCGTCTSFATALNTVLRTIGIPTRMIIVIPIVDASNPNQTQLVEQGITNSQVRQTVLNWLSGAGTGFTSHTFNEVYVGNQWHRLNYTQLGQPILDAHCFGLHTHLYTFNDLSDANLAPTWGWRYGKSIRNDVFGYNNPYTTMILSDPDSGIEPIVIYVDDNAPDDPGPGNSSISDPYEDGSSLHPFDSIQEAIDTCRYLDTVTIRSGVYTGTDNRDIDFKGLAITVKSTAPDNPDIVETTVIDCQASISEPHRGFYFHTSEDSDSILNGLTITNGYASGNWPDGYGGGIICYYNTSPTIKNCIVTNNTAEHHGGGIYSYNSSPTIVNCIFRANSAGSNGGGMHNGPSSPNLINCIFTENTSGSSGGGISTTSTSSPTLTNCTFSNNSSGWQGGAIGSYNSNTLLTNCILWGNTPSEIYVSAGDMPNITYSNVQGGYSGIGNINSNPCFVDSDNSDYHLLCSSPCFNAGDPNYTNYLNESDIDGESRLRYGRIDMGADELFQIAPDFNSDGNIDFGDLAVLREQWLLFGANSYCADIAPMPEGDGTVDFLDFAFFAKYWLLEE